RRPAVLRRGGDRCATCVSTQGRRTSEVRRARRQRAVRCRIRAACNGAHLAHRVPLSRQAGRAAGSGQSSGWSWQRPFFFFSAREKKRNEKKTGEWMSCGRRRAQAAVSPQLTCRFLTRAGGEGAGFSSDVSDAGVLRRRRLPWPVTRIGTGS